jgi:hypothetical protein
MIGTKRVEKGAWAGTLPPAVATALTAAGTTQATGLVLTADVNMIGTAAASTGVNLPAISGPGDTVFVYNGGANAVKVYPAQGSAGTINGIAATTGVSVPAAKGVLCVAVSAANWVAIVSA